MKSPVQWRSLEEELGPVAGHFQGAVLNAGCGDRDITGFLLAHGAASVDNCDRETGLPGAIICDLIRIPRGDEAYDAIILNAVLEHVPDPDLVIIELKRLLKSRGRLIVTAPFLQPYHRDPEDYRRYTRAGLEELGKRHGLLTLEINSVHTLAQSITWIIWSALNERGGKPGLLGRLLLWVPFYAWNRLSLNARTRLQNNACALQAVYQKP